MMMMHNKGGGGGQNVERSARSIFVGNISYDVNEEEVRKLLSACGHIVGFRLVHDRDTGRPKGFGFCEFADVQMAEAAIRNFNGYELRGRPLRVDSATGNDRGIDEDAPFQAPNRSQQGGQSQPGAGPTPMASEQPGPVAQHAAPHHNHQEENPYGSEPEQGKAPEVIARTVASMAPEKMFELMRSMKETVNNNPQMARQLLVENPQLSYALLQAQVVMRVVDPKVAYSMLHREHAQPLAPPQMAPVPNTPATMPPQFQGPPHPQQQQYNMPPPAMPQQFNMPPPMAGQQQQQQFPNYPPPGMGMQPPGMGMPMPMPGMMPQRFPAPQVPSQQQQPSPVPPPQAMPAQSNSNNDNLDEEQQAQMLVRVLQLTDEQIRMLPATERAQVIELRNQLRNAGASA